MHCTRAACGTGQQDKLCAVGHLDYDKVSREQDTEGLKCWTKFLGIYHKGNG